MTVLHGWLKRLICGYERRPDKTTELHEKLVAWRKHVNAPMPTANKK